MIEHFFDQFKLICREPERYSRTRLFSLTEAEKALRFHESIPSYKETSLISLKDAAKENGVKAIYVKDESSRFGLKAFKGLSSGIALPVSAPAKTPLRNRE